MKRSVNISIAANGEYLVKFIRADGTVKTEWGYYNLPNADKNIGEWLADDSPVKD